MEKLITSPTNSYIKHLKKLQTSSKYRNQQKLFLLEGIRPVKDAINYGIVPENIIVSENYKGKVEGVNLIRVPEKILSQISDTVTSQGIMAEVKMKEHSMAAVNSEKMPLIFFSDGISDPGNLGTIIRTLEAAGVNGIVLGKGTVDLYNPKTIRSTMAAVFNIPVYFAENSEDVILSLKKKGYKIIGTRMENAVLYTEECLTEPTVVIMGNEANGISEKLLNICDSFIKIPIYGKIESLNVSVATSIIAYEAVRQKGV